MHSRTECKQLHIGIEATNEESAQEKEIASNDKILAPSAEIEEGFRIVTEIEATSDPETRKNLQFEHLLAIANHEQGVILQPLIYDDVAFANWVQRQRAWFAHWASPALELVFTHECSAKSLLVKSVAPEKMELERLVSRMDWINSAAKQFHGLMITRPDFMRSALGVMASLAMLADVESSDLGMPI